MSEWGKLTHLAMGAAQGSLLSPILFALYISDILRPENTSTILSLSADGTAVFFSL
jgi:hypothetical protein